MVPSYPDDVLTERLQWEFLSQLSKDPANTVIGLVRDKAATDAKVTKELSRDNVHIIAGDITDYDSLKVRPSLMV